MTRIKANLKDTWSNCAKRYCLTANRNVNFDVHVKGFKVILSQFFIGVSISVEEGCTQLRGHSRKYKSEFGVSSIAKDIPHSFFGDIISFWERKLYFLVYKL